MKYKSSKSKNHIGDSKKDKFLTLARDRFDLCVDQSSDIIEQWVDDVRFLSGPVYSPLCLRNWVHKLLQ